MLARKLQALGRFRYISLRVGIKCVVMTAVLMFALGGRAPSTATARVAYPSVAGAAGDCSEATAQTLARQYKLGDITYNYPVGQVLCGSFTGLQSNAIVFSFHYYGCIPTSGFAVFRFQGGDWQLVLMNADPFIFLSAAGSDIRERVDVFRTGDPRCVPSGGTKERIWHWDGQQLVPSAWKQTTPPKALTIVGIYSPSGNLACEMSDEPPPGGRYVGCVSRKPLHQVSMGLSGRLKICNCFDFAETTPFHKLAYGKQQTLGRFRCTSLRVGIKCVVISLGHGFLINSAGIKRV